MIVGISMEKTEKLHVASWDSETPEFVIQGLKFQLEAAKILWPELKEYTIEKKQP